ncbi:MAG: hypothetical protein V1900_02040 [Candidatus Aenigmatarchaeota archaeon]
MKSIGKKWLLLISIPAIIGFVVIFFFNITSERAENRMPVFSDNESRFTSNMTNQTIPPPFFRTEYRQIPMHWIILSPILLMIGIISISYYFISKSLEDKLENNLKFISKILNKNTVMKRNAKNSDNANIILKFLSPSERKVLQKLTNEKGVALQAEISRMEGMDKLKTHRVVKDLEMKGIIKTESYGKTRRIILSNEIKDFMKS